MADGVEGEGISQESSMSFVSMVRKFLHGDVKVKIFSRRDSSRITTYSYKRSDGVESIGFRTQGDAERASTSKSWDRDE